MRQTAVPEPLREDTVGPAEQARRREWFREHWTRGVAFNQHCGIEVRRWDDQAVELFLPYAEVLSAHGRRAGRAASPGPLAPARRQPYRGRSG